MGAEYRDYYRAGLEEAAEYQDFVTCQLLKDGICLNQFASRKYQLERGEGAGGIEVKHDKLMAKTGNAYIETAEKSDPSVIGYTPSGINREDGTWLYLIGDYSEALLMSKRQLRKFFAEREDALEGLGIRKVENGTKTSQGYAVPVAYLDKWLCIRHFKFDDTTEVG